MDDHLARYVLPWPPSVNHYWRNTRRHGRPSKSLTAAAEQFRAEAIAHVLCMCGGHWPARIDGPLDVTVIHHWPDRRVRDADNYSKGLLDALTHARVWHDDHQVRNLHLLDGERVKGGCVVVAIRPALTEPLEFRP